MIIINILFENNETTISNIVIIVCFILGESSVECMALLWKLPIYYLWVTWKG